eukprot:10210246-Karenia_brevis.AAC.1
MTTLKDILPSARELEFFFDNSAGNCCPSLGLTMKIIARMWTPLKLNHAIHNFDQRIQHGVTFGAKN